MWRRGGGWRLWCLLDGLCSVELDYVWLGWAGFGYETAKGEEIVSRY